MARDYIMRLVAQIAALLGGVVAKQQAGKLAEAREELEQTCRQTIGLSLPQLKQLSPEAVAQRLNAAGALRHVRAVTLAELLLLDAELPETDGDTSQPRSGLVHAFCLLADSMSALSTEDQASYRAKLNQLADRLGELRTHPYIKERLRDDETPQAS